MNPTVKQLVFHTVFSQYTPPAPTPPGATPTAPNPAPPGTPVVEKLNESALRKYNCS